MIEYKSMHIVTDIPEMLCDLPGCGRRIVTGGLVKTALSWWERGWIVVTVDDGSSDARRTERHFCGYEHLSAWAEVKAIAAAVADAPPMEPAG